jgi:formate hydrogenlyase subunit 4
MESSIATKAITKYTQYTRKSPCCNHWIFVPNHGIKRAIGIVILGGILFFVKLLVVFVLACVFENTLSRTRFMLTGRLTVVGFGISVLAFVFYFTGL